MANLSDFIEEYLKELLQRSIDGAIEIQRNDLADYFKCVPSQINYVLTTRFSFERGYLVESRRGGGGYVRIVRVTVIDNHAGWQELIGETIGNNISQLDAQGIIQRLGEEGFLTTREQAILVAMLDRCVLKGELPTRDYLRARLLKVALLTILRGDNSTIKGVDQDDV